jgi:hypothetical protein
MGCIRELGWGIYQSAGLEPCTPQTTGGKNCLLPVGRYIKPLILKKLFVHYCIYILTTIHAIKLPQLFTYKCITALISVDRYTTEITNNSDSCSTVQITKRLEATGPDRLKYLKDAVSNI